MDLILYSVTVSALLAGVCGVDFASPLVFDPVFYVNTHGDLHGIKTSNAAEHHWLTTGIKEGRQGSGNFHSKQYLHRYHDLAKDFGTDYKAAIQHYLEHGVHEKRLGYVEGGFEDRYTISNGKDLFVSSSRRTAGAVDSVVWGNKEFINAWDHGRELQLAVNAPPHGECYNPTEAGGLWDRTGDSTKSHLKSITVSGKEMKTSVYPAFWIRHDHACHKGPHPVNTIDTYQHLFSKEVTIGCAGMDTCIKFTSHFEIAGHWPDYHYMNFEAPTGYLAGDFTVIKNYNPGNHQLQPHTSNSLPPVLLTPDNKYAMGVYAPAGQDTDFTVYYATWNFHGNFASQSNKWNVVFRKNEFAAGSTHHLTYVAYICVGTPNTVAECLRKLQETYPKV